MSNAYNNSVWKYKGNNPAANYNLYNGIHSWRVAPSGTADAAITWTDAMTLNNFGNLGIGTTAPGAPLEIYRNQNAVIRLMSLNNPSSGSSAQTAVSYYAGATEKAKFAVNGSGATAYVGGPNALQIWNFSNAPIVFGTNQAERVRIDASGNVGIGTNNPSEKLEVSGNLKLTGTGNINATGTITAGNIVAKYQDVAEWVESSQTLAAGSVVVLDHTKSNQVIASSQAYDTRVAGVISSQPGIALGEKGESKLLVATMGRVKVKVDATAGPIQVGDLLVTSNVGGAAMKSEPLVIGGRNMHAPGTIIGKALEPLPTGAGEILVLLSLQ